MASELHLALIIPLEEREGGAREGSGGDERTERNSGIVPHGGCINRMGQCEVVKL